MEEQGRPHCVAVRVNAERTIVSGYHAEGRFEVAFKRFLDLCNRSVDSRTLVTFQIGLQGEPPQSIYNDEFRPTLMSKLQDLMAGAGQWDTSVDFRYADAALPYVLVDVPEDGSDCTGIPSSGMSVPR